MSGIENRRNYFMKSKYIPIRFDTHFHRDRVFGWFFFSLFIFPFFTSCGDTQIHWSAEPSSTIAATLDLQERKEVITNTLFEAVLSNKTNEEIDQLLSTHKISLFSVNKRGDTVLGVAIQFRLKERALFLLEKFQCDDHLRHQNKKGESYIYLSAREGYEELIHQIANKCYENNFFDFSDYEFSDLDPIAENGEIAIHVALNGSIAATLNYEYDRGSLEYSFFPFYTKNKNIETFLHTAVRDGRVNVIEWAVHHYCDKGDWEKSDSVWKHWSAWIVSHGWNVWQTDTWNLTTQLINHQNKEDNTALHLAAHFHDIQNIKLLSSCRWTKFRITNEDGNLALQMFLEALDDKVKNHSQEIKEAFVFLVQRETYHRKYFNNIAEDTVDHQNDKKDSSAHIAARLADPYFYTYLKQFANLSLINIDGETPADIFERIQSTIQDF